jgi:hypothetical protein
MGRLEVKLAILLVWVCSRGQAFQRTIVPASSVARKTSTQTYMSSFYEENTDESDEDDEYIDSDSLGDWKAFRRNLATPPAEEVKSVSKENEELLKTQSQDLAQEYVSGVWAHTTSTVRIIELNC